MTPEQKAQVIIFTKRAIAEKYGKEINLLIETGTYFGDMIAAQLGSFEGIISIELSPDYYNKASERFKNDTKVILLQGESPAVLAKLLPDIKVPILFWLDAHWCGGATFGDPNKYPIIEELEAIFAQPDYANKYFILIDDLDWMGKYLDGIKALAEKNNYVMTNENTIIKLMPAI